MGDSLDESISTEGFLMTQDVFAGIAEPHRSAITAILRAARLGVFTETEARLFIDRVRKLVSVEDSGPPEAAAVSVDRTSS
jgi:hypothetical protein